MPKNIAILTMSMDIGGAETHIYELSCALSAKGHKVTVFSAGGAYVPMLEAHGVDHIYAPLTSKKPANLISSYKIISRFVKENPHCIIHSHTRISNYCASFVAKKYKVPFISTVHGKFTTGFFQRLFTRWGLRALCVSDDLKQHTMDNYGYNSDKLRVTVNGINLDTFRKRTDVELKNELGLDENNKVVLCVSRLNDTAADHIERVLFFSKELYTKDSNVRLVIVGDGDRFDALKKQSEQINAQTTKDFIQLVGARTDIYRFCNIADLFIGISRSALEAIACEVPVILLGNHGYIGLLNEDTLQSCIDTNFTCRGLPFPDNSVISSLATDILENPSDYKQNTEFGLKLVKERYSVDKMVSDALNTYKEAERDIRDFDTMICGYYGRSNLGDDILLKTITDNLKSECDVKKIALLTADTSNNPYGMDVCIHRFDVLKIRKYMKRTNTFILGGGSILQDATSSRSLYYYLFITNLAVKTGCKTILYSNGIGPINKPYHRKKAAKLLEKIDYITVRDKKSYEYIRSLGVKNERIEITADEVFTIDKSWATGYDLPQGKKYLCVNLHGVDKNEEFYSAVSTAIKRISDDYGYVPVLLPLHFGQDIELVTRVSEALGCEHILIDKQIPHQSTLAVISQSDIVLSERLHGLVISCLFGIPFSAIDYDPKITAFCAEVGMSEHAIKKENVTEEDIYNNIRSVIESRCELQRVLEEKAQSNRMLAQNNRRIANNIIN